MSPRKKQSSSNNQLRQKAEGGLQATQKEINSMSPEEVRHLVQKLQVHQVELENQNEELRETHITLEVARDRYAALFDFSPAGYVVLDKKERMLEVNLRFCQLVGADRKDLLHQSLIRFIDPGDQSKFRRHLERMTNSAGPQTSDILTLRGNDAPHRVRLESCLEAMPNAGSDSWYRMAVVDVTEEESALNVNTSLLQSTKEGIYGLDRQGHAIFFNPAGEELTGWKAANLLGRTPHDFLHHTKPDGSPYPVTECPVLHTLHHGQTVSVETDFLWRKDGTGFPAEYVSAPILNDSGQVDGAVVTFRDITERKQKEEQLRNNRDLLAQQQEELQALTERLFQVQEEERERISRDLHDDISQRLALLQIKTQMAIPPQAGPQYQEILDDIGNLLKDVRKIVYRYHPYTLQDLGLESAIRSLVEDYVKLEHLPITLSTQPIPRDIPLEVITCIYRVAQESFRNIAKHAQATSVQCELMAGPDGVTMKIQDNGVGFMRTASPVRGIGLVSMQERTNHLHGQLSIDSGPGKGTTILLKIPGQEKPENFV